MNVGQAALGRRVQVFARAVPVGDGLFDVGLDRADAVVVDAAGLSPAEVYLAASRAAHELVVVR